MGGPNAVTVSCKRRDTDRHGAGATRPQRPEEGMRPGARERLEPRELEEAGRSPPCSQFPSL